MSNLEDGGASVNNVAPILSPDTQAMQEHLHLLFGSALDGRIEITGIHTGSGVKTSLFKIDDTEAASAWASDLNKKQGWNVYVGASVRKPDTFPGHAADDTDFMQAHAVWVDADNADQIATARMAYRGAGLIPPFVVVTGSVPTRRAQMWWPLAEPVEDIDVLRSTLRGLAVKLGTDPKVCTGKQLMRLAGSLAWPKKDGRVLERTEIVHNEDAPRAFFVDQLRSEFPPIERIEASGQISDITVAPAGSLGLTEKVMDGREGYAFRLVRATLREFIGTTGSEPTADELYRVAAPVYLAKADQIRPGRGPDFLKQKCVEALRSFAEGAIPGMRSLDEAVIGWAEKHPVAFEQNQYDEVEPQSDDLFEVLSIADIKALPDTEWLIEDIVPHNSLGFIYGAPGSYKTFICYDLALSLAYGFMSWLDKPIKHPGSVLYIASEGSSGVKNRITAWQQKHGIAEDNERFRLIKKSMSFMDKSDIQKLEATVAAMVAQFGPVGTVFVDTVSRVLPGADENLQKDMTVFVAACDLIRERFGATVIGVHHTNKNGEMRGSTVFLGQGDFILRVDKNEDKTGGTILCEKQKDAEDGWKKTFAIEKMEWLIPGRIKTATSLVIAFTDRPPADDGDSKWPDRETLKAIHGALAAAWSAGRPWSLHVQTIKDGRFGPRNIWERFNVSAKVAQMVLETWLANEVVAVEMVDAHSKLRGLKVLKWID